MSLLLMIASIAIAVLPVWRSPMISSRWPRPIGIIASIAFSPVCIGSVTGWRCTTPGALNSAGRVSVDLDVALAVERATERVDDPAQHLLADGDLQQFARALTVSPSEMCSHSPNSTAPTLSDSRFSARPVTPWGNSSISKDMQFSRPCRRAMPSATDSTVPTSVSSALPPSSPSMRLLRMLVISSGLICMSISPLRAGPGFTGRRPARLALRGSLGNLPAQLLQSVAN